MTDLDERALAWCLRVIHTTHPEARLEQATPLVGGLDARTHALSFATNRGPLELVLRRDSATSDEARELVSREREVLGALYEPDAWPATPRGVAFDTSGDEAGVPATLMTRLSGAADLRLEGSMERARELGRALASLHRRAFAHDVAVPPSEHATEPVPRPESGIDWPRVARAVRTLPPVPSGLIHGDYHMGNVLFEQGKLTGVVDWSTAERGAREFDVGYCRMDLSVAFGGEQADEFLVAYEVAYGARVEARPVWDLAGALRAYPDVARWLPSWHAWGRRDLTVESVRDALRRFVEARFVELGAL